MAFLWPSGGNKTNWGNIQAKKHFFFQKNTLCHSFRITVIPSVLLSFLPDNCHSFQIIVIPSRLVSLLPNIVIPSELLPFQIFVTLNSSGTLPYPKSKKNGHRRWPYMRVLLKSLPFEISNLLFFCNAKKINNKRLWVIFFHNEL